MSAMASKSASLNPRDVSAGAPSLTPPAREGLCYHHGMAAKAVNLLLYPLQIISAGKHRETQVKQTPNWALA